MAAGEVHRLPCSPNTAAAATDCRERLLEKTSASARLDSCGRLGLSTCQTSATRAILYSVRVARTSRGGTQCTRRRPTTATTMGCRECRDISSRTRGCDELESFPFRGCQKLVLGGGCDDHRDR